MKQKSNTILFTNKLSQCLSKFRQTSTIQIGHQLFKQLLQPTQLKQIIIPFLSKMDTSDRLTDREKKEYSKVYIQFIDHFGQEILYQTHYQRFMESLAKKTLGVADVIGHLCKGYLSRIHPIENSKNYIIFILSLFKHHNQIPKIIKHISQSINPSIISCLQYDMLSILAQKQKQKTPSNIKSKSQYIQAMMALVLSIQNKFQCQNIIQPILVKNLKSEDYNVRKACVDICYALIVVKEEINSVLHDMIKQLKYDKIKHVRDSVGNYEALYRQVYGNQEAFRPQIYSQKTVRNNQRTYKSPIANKGSSMHNNNNQAYQKFKTQTNQFIVQTQKQKERSQMKNHGKIRNQIFFQNAKNNDTIRVSDDFNTIINQSQLNDKIHMNQNQQNSYKGNIIATNQKQKYLINNNNSTSLGSYSQAFIPILHQKQKHTKNISQALITVHKSQQKINNQNKKSTQNNKNQPKTIVTPNKNNNKFDLTESLSKQNKQQIQPISSPKFNLNLRKLNNLQNHNQNNLKNSDVNYFGSDQDDNQNEINIYAPSIKKKQQNLMYQNNVKEQGSKSKEKGRQKKNQNYKNQNKIDLQQQLPTLIPIKKQPQHLSINPFLSSNPLIANQPITHSQIQFIFKQMFSKLQQKINCRFQIIQNRLGILEQSYSKISFGKDNDVIFQSADKRNEMLRGLGGLDDSEIQFNKEEFNNNFYNNENILSNENIFVKNNGYNVNMKKRNTQLQAKNNSQWLIEGQISLNPSLESNLVQKVRTAINSNNIDQAYSLVLANKKKSLLIKLLSLLFIPKDKTVQQCLLLQIKKHLNHKQTLKWLKNYMIQNQKQLKYNQQGNYKEAIGANNNNGNIQKIFKKIKIQLQKQDIFVNKDKDYLLLRKIVINQIQDIFNS